MLRFGLAALLSVLPFVATPAAAAEPYAMADAGVTIHLPAGWEMTRWSDWDFTAKSSSGLVLKVWETPWQLEFDERFKADVVKVYTDDLDGQRGGDITVTVGTPGKIGAIPTLPSVAHFKFDRKGAAGIAYAEAIAADGKMLHFVVYSAASNAARAKAGVEEIVAGLTVDKGPADIASLGGVQKTQLGFSVALPAGWRTPLATEKAEVATLAAAAAIKKPDDCFQAARPGLANVEALLICQQALHLAIVDEYSFDGESELLKNLIFGKAAAKIPKATAIQAKDRMGILYAPTTPDHDLRMGVMPYDRGQAVAWLVGPSGAGADLDAAAKTALSGITWEGPNGGLPAVTAGDEVVHILTYRPFHPAVLACVGVAFMTFAGLGYLAFRPRPKKQDYSY